jgi:hypothetical protein
VTDAPTTPQVHHPEGSGTAGGLKRELAGIPAWGWGAIIVVALLVSWYVRRRAAASAATTAPAPVSGAAADGSAPLTSGVTAANISPYLDNNAWGVAAETALLQDATGIDPATIDSAIRDYLAGDTLTPDESTVISRALTLIGPTPEVLSSTGLGSLTDPGTLNTDVPPNPVSQLPPSTQPAPTPAPASPLQITGQYEGFNPSGSGFVDAGSPSSGSPVPTVWSTVAPVGAGAVFEHQVGGTTYYASGASPADVPNTLPPGATLPPWAKSAQDYFSQQ